MGKIHPFNMQGYHNTGCYSCKHRHVTIIPVCRNNYENVVNEVKIYCKLKKMIVDKGHERCNRKNEDIPIKPLGEYSHV